MKGCLLALLLGAAFASAFPVRFVENAAGDPLPPDDRIVAEKAFDLLDAACALRQKWGTSITSISVTMAQNLFLEEDGDVGMCINECENYGWHRMVSISIEGKNRLPERLWIDAGAGNLPGFKFVQEREAKFVCGSPVLKVDGRDFIPNAGLLSIGL